MSVSNVETEEHIQLTLEANNYHCILCGGVEWSGVEFATDSQSASTSWCRAALWGP
jgi:hypothetical protein